MKFILLELSVFNFDGADIYLGEQRYSSVSS